MAYARHQTFYLRDGWIRKGLQAVVHDPSVFVARDTFGGMSALGLGVNMVESLRFWLVALGLTREVVQGSQKGQHLTPFGELLLAHDPYVESDGTLWLLHAHLTRTAEGATTWYWFFNHFARMRFDKAAFIDELDLWVRAREARALARSTLAHDFDCLIRTYLPSGRGSSPEDTLDCPLASLDLLTVADESTRTYRLVPPPADRMHPLSVLYMMLWWQEMNVLGNPYAHLADVLRRPGNAGRVFALGATTLTDILARLEELWPQLAVRIVRTAGLDTLRLPEVTADEVLHLYFAELSAKEVHA